MIYLPYQNLSNFSATFQPSRDGEDTIGCQRCLTSRYRIEDLDLDVGGRWLDELKCCAMHTVVHTIDKGACIVRRAEINVGVRVMP